ncbi:uncharacterized protein LOC123350050 isoform X2 [Mauremys mutica]|uniref:uncharacterized protein LOC123350050 isoform X2 n=1 Tax=Mauremys mutica TaxID=74926 RepID=UPI001D166493|nr:uncharacterized protein LOC123350050 isoform X2 [Mauremys mutica]
MERIRQMLRRKAGQVAPQPEEDISQPAQVESGPSVPAGGEEARGQGKERSCFACWRRRKTAAPLAEPEAPSGPKRRWPRVQLWSREPGKGRSWGRQLWGFLFRKPRSQELRPRAQQELPTTMAAEGPCASPTLALEEPPASPTLAPEEPPASPTLATEEPPASPTLAMEEPPASPEQEFSDCSATDTSSSAFSCGASSSSVGSGSPVFEGSLFGDTPSAQVSWPEEEEEEKCEEEEEQDLCPEEDIILVIQQHLQGRAEALHNCYSRSLDTILRGQLTETPTMEKLQHLLEHVHCSLLSNNTQERARAIQTSSSLPPPCLDLTPPPPSPWQVNLCCSWVSGYPTQPVTSVGMPGVGYTGCTSSCFRRGGSTPERPQTCGARTGSMTPSAWGIEIWPGWESLAPGPPPTRSSPASSSS